MADNFFLGRLGCGRRDLGLGASLVPLPGRSRLPSPSGAVPGAISAGQFPVIGECPECGDHPTCEGPVPDGEV
jgi:hypothetical protein